MERIYSDQMEPLIMGIIISLFATLSIFILDWRLGLLALVFGVITTIISTDFARSLLQKYIHKSLGAVTERLTDILVACP